MLKLKKVSELICPTCKRNDPVFIIDYELRAWPSVLSISKENNESDDIEYYDLHVENDTNGMASWMDEAISNGEARCVCCICGSDIEYYKEVPDETEHNRSSE